MSVRNDLPATAAAHRSPHTSNAPTRLEGTWPARPSAEGVLTRSTTMEKLVPMPSNAAACSNDCNRERISPVSFSFSSSLPPSCQLR
jgi:hypothetical protein